MVDMIDQVDAMPMETGGCDNEPVEMAVFEQDKENIRPARAGRNPAKLAEAVLRQHDVDECSSGAHSFDDARKMERQDFESRVALLAEATARSPQKDDDEAFTRGTTGALVQLWANYARWAAEWYPADCHEERSVLERATSNLADRPNCFEDLQHLRLWLRLADFSQEPQDLFSFLWTRGIGLTHASLYEAWSASLERQHRFEEAEEALQVGRARGAQPVDRLAALCEAFAARMRARVLRSAEDGFESMVGQDVRALGRMLPGSADPFFMQRDELVPAPLQRPTLNVLTAAEGPRPCQAHGAKCAAARHRFRACFRHCQGPLPSIACMPRRVIRQYTTPGFYLRRASCLAGTAFQRMCGLQRECWSTRIKHCGSMCGQSSPPQRQQAEAQGRS